MKRVYSRLALLLILYALLTLTLSVMCVSGVKGAEQTRPQKLREDNSIRATFLIDYRWFSFRLVYNNTTETYSVYSQGELVVGDSINKKGELVAENVQGPAVSSNGTYNPRDIYDWFKIKEIDNVTIVYYDGMEVLVVVSENPVSSVITVLSPENKTYSTTDVALEYKVNRIFYTATYSLDGQANQTITGNTVLTGLTEGPHSIVIYIEVTPEDATASKTIYFTVSSNNNGTEILTHQTDDTSTSTKNETPDYSTDEPETTNTKEDNSNEIPPTIQQGTNIPNMSTMVSLGIVPSGFLAAGIGTSNLFLTYALIGILVTAASWFLTEIRHVEQMQGNMGSESDTLQ